MIRQRSCPSPRLAATFAMLSLSGACSVAGTEASAPEEPTRASSAALTATASRFSDANGWGSSPSRYATIRYPDINGDGNADVCGRDASGIRCFLSDGASFATEVVGPALFSDASGAGADRKYWSTIQYPDIDGDGKADVCGRAPDGVHCFRSTGTSFIGDALVSEFSDANGWGDPKYYAGIQLVDVTGDGKADLCARYAAGVRCHPSTGRGFGSSFAGPAFSDAAGWSDPKYSSTLRFADVNGDGRADVCARSASGVSCYPSTGNGFGVAFVGPALSDASGWGYPFYYSTIRFADVNGDRVADVCARSSVAIHCWSSAGTVFPAESRDSLRYGDAGGWSDPKYYTTIELPDVNGDGRADTCARSSVGVECELSTPPPPSAACLAQCEPLHRACDFGAATVAVCGGCKAGFVADATGQCLTAGAGVPCPGLDCGPRPPRRCAEITCPAPQSCTEATATDDARCAGGPACTEEQGFVAFTALGDGDAGHSALCRTCAFAPACNDVGETGRRLATTDAEGTECVCEVADGYFSSPVTGTAVACDADGDGWVNENAQEVIDDPNPVVRSTARCHVQVVGKVVLENETHVRKEIAVTSAELPDGLPLYESERNDTFYGTDDETPGEDAVETYARIGRGKLLNSFTKVCADAKSDFNDNGLADVIEASNSELGPGFEGDRLARKKLVQYYRSYMAFGYFLELHNGWYEASASGAGPGVYRIQERLRVAEGAIGVAIQNLRDPAKYWRACPRHTDAAYADKALKMRVGGDFSMHNDAKGGMTHHSQFKCVQIVPESEYRQATASKLTQPQMVFNRTGVLSRLSSSQPTAVLEPMPGTFNYRCKPKVASLLGVPGDNPAFVGLECEQPLLMNDLAVGWLSVTGIDSYDAAGVYQRGCVDLCRETPNGGCGAPATCSSAGGFPACLDGDECKARTASCAAGTACENTVGAYKCVACASGFTSDGFTCRDIDECTARTASCARGDNGTYCQNNLAGGYTCAACPAGHESDGYACSDIDECARGTGGCDAHARCANTAPGNTCACTWPWEGNGRACTPHNFCAPNNGGCSPYAACTNNLTGPVTCRCNAGYRGDGKTCTKIYVPPPPPPSCAVQCADDPQRDLCTCLCQNRIPGRIRRQC